MQKDANFAILVIVLGAFCKIWDQANPAFENKMKNMRNRYALREKLRDYLGIFPNLEEGRGSTQFPIFCKFLVCQINSELLKHVLQTGRVNTYRVFQKNVP